MAYLITAQDHGKLIQAQRIQKSNAALVALKFFHKGFTDVAIRDEEGRGLDIEALRRQHMPSLGS